MISANETHVLRQKILRPHQPLSEMVYPLDELKESLHLGAYSGEKLIGIVSVYPESASGELHQGEWRIRGMAVDLGWRGRGVGRQLLRNLIRQARLRNVGKLWCNARTSALGFYESLGFRCQGEEFEIEGIGPHFIAELSD